MREAREGVDNKDRLLGLLSSNLPKLPSAALIESSDFRGLERELIMEAWGEASSIMERLRECINDEDTIRGLKGRENDAALLTSGSGRAVGDGKAGSTACTVFEGFFSEVKLLVD